MIELYILDVPEFRPIIDEGVRHAERYQAVGNYMELASDGELTIERKKANVRRAVWFSSIGALRNGKVTHFDSEVLHIEPE